MKNFKRLIFTIFVVVAGLSTLTSAKNTSSQHSLKDPGIIHQESILYWLTKRGELKADANEAEKKRALTNYIKASKNGGFKLPGKLAKYDSELENTLKSQRAEANLKTIEVKNAANKTVKILAVLIDFPDLPYNNNRLSPNDTSMYYSDYSNAHYNNLIFSTTGYSGPASQNLTTAYQYYQAVSGGSLFLEGHVAGWVTADNNAATYGANDPDRDDNDLDVPSLVKEAVTKAVAAGGFNLADYDIEDQFDLDNDGNIDEPDGIIDHVMIFHSSIGEEAGGGVLGEDAIWSHRFFVDVETFGYTIPGTSFSILGYTIEPLDSAVGVVVHEFGHDLGGLPDEYNTDSSADADGSPVGVWSLMASGSWAGEIPGTKPVDLSPFASNIIQQRYGGNWINPTVYTLNQLASTVETVTLNESVNHQTGITNLIKVELPKPLLRPFTGTYQYYSGEGDQISTSMQFDVSIPASISAVLQMKAHWNIEVDYDYVQVLVNGTVVAGNHTKLDNEINPLIQNIITDVSANIPGASGIEGWVDLNFDLSAFSGQTVTVRFEYVTDQSVGGYGFIADNIELVADSVSSYFDGAELDGIATLAGFQRITTKEAAGQNYWLQMRGHSGVDRGLAAENYQRGLLVWLEDQNYTDNNVNLHPGHGFLGVIDAGQTIVMNGLSPSSTATQIRDATFTLNVPNKSSTFNDGDDYSTPEQPTSGMILPNHGLTIDILSEAPNSSFASLMLSVGEVPWTANYSFSKNYRSVTFTNQSSGTGNSTASWDFGDGSALNTEWNPSHTYQSSGDFTVVLTVTTTADNSTSVSTQTVTIAELLTTIFQAVDNNGQVAFTTTTTGGEGTATYSWNFGDGSGAGTGSTANHNYNSSGSYTVILTVTSADNQTAISTQTVIVYILPVARYTTSISNLTANFSNTSTGGDTSITYGWEFGDGLTSAEVSPVHTYANAGTYTVKLTMTDGQMNSSSLSSSITVSNPPPPTPSGGGGGGSSGFFTLGLLLLIHRLNFHKKQLVI